MTRSIGFIDTHCHLALMAQKDSGLVEKTRKAIDTGELAWCIDVGTGVGDLPERLAAMHAGGCTRCSAGLYPSHSADRHKDVLFDTLASEIDVLINHQSIKLVAIGEIGIDLHWNYAPVGQQADLFMAQIQLANQLELPIIIHNRDADSSVEQCLRSCPPNKGGLLHCFSSDLAFAQRMLDFGLLVSFAGNLSYKNSQTIQHAAKLLPATSLVCETDSPYLSPLPYRGQLNYPGRVGQIYQYLAQVRNMPLSDLCVQIASNLGNRFGW